MGNADPVIELDNAIATARLLADEIGAAPPLLQGRYELRATLGRGAHGLVCEALDRHLRRPVALKLMPLQGPRAADYAVREAQTLAQFDHPNIVRIFDVGQATEVAGHRVDLVFVVMELLQGTNLRRWLTERQGLAAVREVFLAAGEGLAAAHARGFVHGDFKPENVVIDSSGHVRVVDFGLARWGGGEVPAGESVGTARTLTQGPRGTPGYIAPEVFASRIDARSDQYSFGISLWEAVLGRMPTLGESERSGVTLPAGLRRLLERACDGDPASRFPSMQQLLAELRAVDLSPPIAAAPPMRTPPWWARPGAVFLASASALGGLAVFMSQGDSVGEPPVSKAVVAAGVAPACSEIENIAGEWSFTTSVQWASEQRFVGEHGYYWLEVRPDGGCRAVFLVRKHGDSSAPKYRNIWQDRVVSTATWGTGGAIAASLDTWLGKNRPLDGSDTHRDGLHYRYSLRWAGDRLEGDWEMLDSKTGAQAMRGVLTGIRGATKR
jgi:hypothetical protein